MNHKDTKIAVLGDGGWGTTLALLLSEKGYNVTLWGAFSQYTNEINKKRENTKFLPGFHIPESIQITSDLSVAFKSGYIVLAVPSQHLGNVVKKVLKQNYKDKIFVVVAKGIETKTLRVMSQVVLDLLGPVKMAVLSGPNIAREIAQKMPAAASAASSSSEIAKKVRELFSTQNFTVFESSDVLGVQLGGSFKNVIAICAGMVEGMGLGSNTRAMLFARGIAEMARLGEAMGAKRETFMGLSGLGDLATTCLSPHSRNRSLGCEIGKGKKLRDILSESEMVVEGVETAKAVHELARKHRVTMPISEAVYKILFKNEKVSLAVQALLHSDLRRELD